MPDSGDGGSTTIVRLNGYSAGETVRIRWSQGSNGVTLAANIMIGAIGSAAKTVTIPGSAQMAHRPCALSAPPLAHARRFE